ncbi:MAG: hypothetical protein HON53_06330 [Planctomycetaceae bacterium]|nr:hypothetical protein [Planctomycetaceae bacterium]
MQYQHTQRAPMHYLLWAIAIIQAVAAAMLLDELIIAIILLVSAAIIALFAACFMHLTIQDVGDRLTVHYGPLPLFHKTILYADVTEAKAGRSSLIDGWGIHYVPSRGWTYNLWGFDCVDLKLGQKSLRIGTDDVSNLLEHLNQQIHTP